MAQVTFPPPPRTEADLTEIQRARVAALSEADAVLGRRDGEADATDLVAVASWIIDGRNPWTED